MFMMWLGKTEPWEMEEFLKVTEMSRGIIIITAQAKLIWAKPTLHNQSPIHIIIMFFLSPNNIFPIDQLHLSLTNMLNQSKSPY